MAKINLAHVRIQGLDCAIFEAKPAPGASLDDALRQLVTAARRAGLHVDKAALVYQQAGTTRFWGHQDLVKYLSGSAVPRWTHIINV